ncbi:type VI secretion system contractile sheath domain-containing protein [Hahella ganghwensis]|uniref:type VI secretion system contractile sheath domain-containing protein n=1 Tax=Hahella ganghwensis TaxID=286420 RepID=UPI00037D8EEA|nr:type VI secretion system contractile sheath large subunit [Hahella ganghwensis]
MPGPTMSTGGISLNNGKNTPSSPSPVPRTGAEPFHVLILGNFSGQAGVAEDQPAIGARKIHEIDRDNFEEVFAALNVTLNLPISDAPIKFTDIDDLHPDFIYDRIPLFDKFKSLKRRLKSADTFAEAAREIDLPDAPVAETVSEAPPAATTSEAVDPEASMLDALLDSHSGRTSATVSDGTIDVSRLVKDIFAPYVIKRPDPRQDEYLSAVDQAASHLMRKILHASAFQQLEACWRGLYLLVRNLETDSNLKLYIADVSQQEVTAEAEAHEDFTQSQLYKLVIDRRTTAGGTPFSLLMGDYCFRDETADVGAALLCGQLAAHLQVPFLAGAHERIAGCSSLAETPDPDDWALPANEEFQSLWTSLRESEPAGNLGLTCPRFMLRLPYGKRTSPTERFTFEELPDEKAHEFYCWANSAWLATLLIAQHRSELGRSFTLGRIQQVSRLPLHTYDDDGEPTIKPCAEILMVDRAAGRLLQAGLMPVRSVANKNAVLIPGFESMAEDNAPVQGPWAKA